MRVLIFCPCPIDRELGAAQVHLNLSAALRARGHVAAVWAPPPLPEAIPPRLGLWWARAQLEKKLRQDEPFDVIDCPPVLPCRRLVDSGGRWVARSTQPDALYAWHQIRGNLRPSMRALRHAVVDGLWGGFVAVTAYQGMRAAHVVVCHSEREKAWLGDTFPSLRSRLHAYGGAISDEERAILARVRRTRQRNTGRAARFLWIGRWTQHKGIDTLLTFLRSRLDRPTDETFTIAGCGQEGLNALAPFHDSGRVRVVPSYGRRELPDLLASHDAGLFTSHVEGWGLVLNEMVEAGLPIYATPAGGVDELRAVFGSFVQAFPPAVDSTMPPQPTEETFVRYESAFSWSAVADRYLKALGQAGVGR